jgi:LPS-assembly lipoprotein
VVFAALGGCGDGGFRPMYAAHDGDVRLDQKLAAVEVAPIGGRTGQRLRNELVFQNTGGGAPATPRYRLEIVLRESSGATLVKTTGESASAVYNLDSTFRLVDLNAKKVIFQGTSASRASFDRFNTIYSNIRAADDAADRAAKTMADEIKTRVAAFLSRNQA